ncbi:MAG: hypothetical protein ACLFS5_07700 [Spirochaetaceae bacterium]
MVAVLLAAGLFPAGCRPQAQDVGRGRASANDGAEETSETGETGETRETGETEGVEGAVQGAAGAGAEPTGVLLSGPRTGRGLPFIVPNTFEYDRGLYDTPEGTAEVYCTEGRLYPEEGWAETSCGELDVAVVSAAPVRTMYYRLPEEAGHVFFRFIADGGRNASGPGPSLSEEAACAFIEAFIERFEFFRETTRHGRQAAFPAVIP